MAGPQGGRRSRRRAGLVGGGAACALLALAAVPGVVGAAHGAESAATSSVADGSASALTVVVGGQAQDSGTYAVSNDGVQQTSTGTNSPAITALAGQSALSVGTLAQDATTSVSNGQGSVAACSGIAGAGATVVAAGEGGCLSGGQTLRLDAGSIDLTQVRLVESDLLQGVDQQLRTALQPVLGQVLPAVTQGARTVLDGLGRPGLYLDLGALQSWCQAVPGSATGGARLAGAAAYVQMPGQRIDLISLPVEPAPNTPIVTGLDQVTRVVLDAVRQQARTTVDGTLRSGPGLEQLPLDQLPLDQLPGSEPLDQALKQVEDAVVENVVAQVASQLAPLEDNLLRGTLNKQSSSGPGSIDVQALDLEVLPAAASFGVQALQVQVARSTCAAGSQTVVAGVQETAEETKPKDKRTPKPQPTTVPTRITSGLEAAPADDDGWPAPVLLGLGAAALLAGAGAFRSALRDLSDDASA